VQHELGLALQAPGDGGVGLGALDRLEGAVGRAGARADDLEQEPDVGGAQ